MFAVSGRKFGRIINESRSVQYWGIWLQPRNAGQVRRFLDGSYPQKWMGSNNPQDYIELTKLYLLLWSFVKSKVYLTPPITPGKMQNRIRFAIQVVTLEDVEANLKQRLRLFLQENCRNYEALF